ncbi:MAG: glycosyltransferase family 39 protein [Cyanobacteria bacterium]|nr:glycosyltransferase family 39 protein [Cyanobacteriota bacterium]
MTTPWAKAAALAALVIVIGSLQLTRPGYSVDEEFTVFAVRGIAAHGLPVLPSGLLYDRGIAYSYAAWLAGAVAGAELPAFRAVSLLAAAASVFLTVVLIRRLTDNTTALVASIFALASVPFWATATSARFYAPFLAAYLLTLMCFTHRHWWLLMIAAAAIARLTHELAFTLAVIPIFCWLLNRDDRRRWAYAILSTVAGLVIGQSILFALHAMEPSSGETMVRRFFLWQVLNLFERPGDRQFGIPLVVMVIAWLVAPTRARTIAVIALSITAAILAFSIAQATNTAPLSLALVNDVLVTGSRYPLDMFWSIARSTPLTLLLALAMLAMRSQRAMHAIWIGWVVWFGVIESGITTNYLLLPITFMLIAIAIDVTARVPRARTAAIALVAIIVAIDQWGLAPMARLAAARPTIHVAGIDEIRNGIQPNDRVACTDELGCLMLVGRIDRWLALDDYVRERFVVQKADGAATGVYTGVPAAFRPGDLFAASADGTLPDRIVIVDIFKDYPIGSSRSWVPRAIEQDGLQVTPLLETPQMRVLQVSPRELVARWRANKLLTW